MTRPTGARWPKSWRDVRGMFRSFLALLTFSFQIQNLLQLASSEARGFCQLSAKKTASEEAGYTKPRGLNENVTRTGLYSRC
jgi:hypothetical protein